MYEGSGASSLTPSPAALRLSPWQIVAPGVVILPEQLMVDEPVDGLMGDDSLAGLKGEASGHLLRRPALFETGEDLVPQSAVPVQLGATPSAGAGLLVGIDGLVPLSL